MSRAENLRSRRICDESSLDGEDHAHDPTALPETKLTINGLDLVSGEMGMPNANAMNTGVADVADPSMRKAGGVTHSHNS
jgi:hypothetical protein